VILVDANILLYAEDSSSPHHDRARKWWDDQLSGAGPVCLCWTIISAFIRISTNRRVFKNPLTMDEAVTRVDSWFVQPCVQIIQPRRRHWVIFQKLLLQSQALGNLVTDAHIAALALEHSCLLYSTDADFSRFPGLKWKNPLKD